MCLTNKTMDTHEKWPQEPTQLKKEEAQEKANMMKAVAEKASSKSEEKLSKEDYDRALEVVEEIKKMAEKEPTTEKILFKLSRLVTKSAYGVQICLTYLSTLPDKFIATSGLIEDRDKTLEKFNDATLELQRLKNEAKKFEENTDKQTDE